MTFHARRATVKRTKLPKCLTIQTSPCKYLIFKYGTLKKNIINVCDRFQVDESVISTSDHGDDHISVPVDWQGLHMDHHSGGMVSTTKSESNSGPGSHHSHSSQNMPSSSYMDMVHDPVVVPTSGSGYPSQPLPGQPEVLTVATGEPVTHFNLDQLLEIVQSFQLDTTMAGHEEGKPQIDLAVARSSQYDTVIYF